VNVSCTVDELQTFDIYTGVFLSKIHFELGWVDKRLIWNPDDYGGITHIPLRKDTFWETKLDINLESLDDSNFVKLYSAALYNDGTVLEIRAGTIEFYCTVDVTLFPFDIHDCYASLYTYQYTDKMVVFVPTEDDIRYKPIEENMEWTLHRTTIKAAVTPFRKDENISVLYYHLWIKRRPAFQVITYFVPAFTLTVLTGMSTWIPPNSGERTCFIITLYLATVFLSSSVVSGIPHSSLNIPYVSIFNLITNMAYAFAVMWSVFIVRISHFSNESDIPKWLRRKAIMHKVGGCVKVRPSMSDDVDIYSISSEKNFGNKEDETTESEFDYDDISCSWLDVTTYLDRKFAFSFSASVVSVCLVFLVVFFVTYNAHASDATTHIGG